MTKDEIVWVEIRPSRRTQKMQPRQWQLAVVVDPGWLEYDTDSAKLAHENSWIEVKINGQKIQADPFYVKKASLLEQIAFAAQESKP